MKYLFWINSLGGILSIIAYSMPGHKIIYFGLGVFNLLIAISIFVEGVKNKKKSEIFMKLKFVLTFLFLAILVKPCPLQGPVVIVWDGALD